jgi:4-hydroxy-2-oxoheptanedioate aldolase
MLLDAGAMLVAHGADILAVKQGFEEIQQKYAGLGFQFDNRLAAEAAAIARQR